MSAKNSWNSWQKKLRNVSRLINTLDRICPSLICLSRLSATSTKLTLFRFRLINILASPHLKYCVANRDALLLTSFTNRSTSSVVAMVLPAFSVSQCTLPPAVFKSTVLNISQIYSKSFVPNGCIHINMGVALIQ